MAWTVRGSNSNKGKKLFSFFNIEASSGAHPSPYSMGTGVLFPRRRERKKQGRLHLVPTLRMGGAMPLFPLYAFVALTGLFYHHI
jgi:hypothetical protein